MMQETRPASAAALTARTEAPQNQKTTIRKIALASVCAVAAFTVAAANANATPLTQYAWTSTFVDGGPGPGSHGNNIAFTGTFSNNNGGNGVNSGVSTQYTASLNTASAPDIISQYLTICETGNSWGTGTENVSVTFAFTEPGQANGSINGTVKVTGWMDPTGTITWANPDLISFADGAQIQVSLGKVSGWDVGNYNGCLGNCATVNATFTVLSDPTSVLEPASMALLGVGMIGTGVVARRRHRLSSPMLAA
ncbi:PEP-CTERM sorting domain-containing protein [Rhodopila globiformis]|uniref:Ice-binding protein C-terminal domain-containing protein n=1 Tax=Rhodopila globiformis TaxID=1071 RepID=A0A2S6NNQ1_RHOGL|nr:PEP-CTERM sorting domain-containing protein [Rhodopila globiformis]PPQ39035.1 hypothetical protein CCS01_01745 [Rhodopila globiformis]